MIGDRYNIDTWNCTHEVSQWYMLRGYPNAVKPVTQTDWGRSFVRWMRKRFVDVHYPVQGALVVMTNKYTGGMHVGVWDRGMVHHCHNPINGRGQTIRTPLHLIKLDYVIIRYCTYNEQYNLLRTGQNRNSV